MISPTGNLVHSSLFIVRRLNNSTAKRGFTLMEMLVVMAVIVLLLGISIPFFAGFSKGKKLKTTAEGVSAILNTARSQAISRRQDLSVIFDYLERPHCYYIVDQSNQLYGKKYYLPSSIRFYRPQDPSNPTSFLFNRATFSSRGGLTGSSGAVWISDQRDQFRRITVSNTTGRVRIDREP